MLLSLDLSQGGESVFAGGEYPSISESRTQIVLYSWLDNRRFLFAFVQKEKADSFLDHFSPDYAGVELPMVEFEIDRLPTNSVILWREFAPKKINYPPNKIIDQVRQIAARRGIQVQVTPTIYD